MKKKLFFVLDTTPRICALQIRKFTCPWNSVQSFVYICAFDVEMTHNLLQILKV